MNYTPKTAAILLALASLLAAATPAEAQKFTYNTFGTMKARAIGPATSSGRITAIEAVYINVDPTRKKDRRLAVYAGAAAGGVWKSMDGGTTFKPIFDKEKQHSVGAMALDPRRADSVLWVGTGESNVRNSVSIGGGLYKTTDAGATWQMLGLEKVERIAKIALNPKNPDVALVAGLGALWGDSPDRGLYRTTDGGKTFDKVLYVNEKTGCADVAIDPENPDVCYAAMWEFRRTAYSFNSGGSGSGLYKSADGGKTWNKLTNTMPAGDLGRVIVAIAPSKPNVVYAMIESKESGLYRSEDRGETWKKTSNALSVTARPFYFSCLYVDPYDPNRVYRPSFQLGISNDGGRTFNGFNYGGGAHPDHHALWIDPENPQHLLLGTDGGVYSSNDRGVTWVQSRNLPLAQAYRISYDFEAPYNVFCGLQDNGSWMTPHRTTAGGIQNKNWEATGWGDGFAIIRDRHNPDIMYFESQGGNAIRRHIKSSESKPIKPFEEEGAKKLRFNWNTPITQSPKNPRAIYIGSQFVHRSSDHGDTWQRISPDLTTNDSAKFDPQGSGGVTADNTSAENHCTIFSIAESPLDEKIIWAGTDDGNLQCTADGGKTWTNTTPNLPATLPKGTSVSTVEPGHFDKATCYATFDNHTRGDMTSYVFRTTDFGKTWKSLADDTLRGFAHVIREDLVNNNLLFVGTEMGMYCSIDGGASWARFKNGLPATPVRDIAIHPRDNDLIIGTHGRGLYIIDDLVPLRNFTPATMQKDVVILPSRPTPIRFQVGFQEFPGADEFVGENPDDRAEIVYYLKSRHMIGSMTVEVLDPKGNVLATLPASKRKGLNRVMWDMSIKPPKVAVSQNTGGGNFGPTVLPGDYTVRITKNGEVTTGKVTLAEDPQSMHKLAARTEQFNTMMKIYAMIERLALTVEQATSVRDSLKIRAAAASVTEPMTGGGTKLPPEFIQKAQALVKTLDSLHKTMVAAKSTLFADTEDQLREKIADLYGDVAFFAGQPSAEQLKRLATLEKDLTAAEQAVRAAFDKELPGVNSLLRASRLPEVKPVTKEEFEKES
jgi:photosystem II stability/assembly factor-like uncharacterized protein